MKQLYITLTFIICSLFAYPQGQANNWYFGQNAGITFNGGPPTALTNGALSTSEGCASISDKNGNLLFYTDGIRVYNKNHVQMPNGNGLFGDPSSAQSGLIIPKPGSNTFYYVFTVAAAGGANGFRYSEVDMTLNGGLGDVVAATKNTLLFTPSCEKLTAVKHANGLYVWVLGHGLNNNKYYAYLVDCNGVNAPITTNVGSNEGGPGWGYLVSSPDGHHLGTAMRSVGFELLDFDNATGIVSNPLLLGHAGNCYGISFSPNNNLLYGCDIITDSIFQWNLQAGSQALIKSTVQCAGLAIGTNVNYTGGALQLGPDGKIYVCQYGQPYLSVINNPDVLGTGCNFQTNAIDLLGRNSVLGLPPFIQSYFDTTAIINYTGNCPNHATAFTISGNTTYLDSVHWNFGDAASGAQNFSSALSPSHTYGSNGTYTVQLIRYLACVSDTSTTTVTMLAPSTSSTSVTLCPGGTYTRPAGAIATAAGTYTDTIPAANGCDSIITTTLSLINVSVVASNDTGICNGQSAQLNATGGLIYSWTPTTGLSDPNIANPVATPTTTTTYTVSSQVPIGNNIVNGDFSGGNTGFSSSYTYTTPNTTEGQYYVGTNAQNWNGGMASCGDHTTGNGNMLLVNGATSANVTIYCQTVNVLPNTDYAFSTWLMTLSVGNPAQLQFSINGNLIGSVFTANNNTCIWQQFYSVWNSGANTTANICIVNQNTNASANDFALDDVSFALLCTGTDTVRVTINPPYTDTVNVPICQGETYTLPNGNTVSATGTYNSTFQTASGCDSIIVTNLTVYPTYSFTVTQTICPSDIYTLPSGNTVNATGTYVDTLQSIHGCDSVITTNLTVVTPTIVASNDTAVCLGSSAQLNATGGLYTYSWQPTTGLSDPNIANPVATPTTTTSYVVTSQVASGDLIANGDFSGGNTGFSSSYTYSTDLTPAATYYVGTNPNTYHSGFTACTDHTTGTGNMMIVNGAGTPNTSVWCGTINVLPNTNYAFSCWVASVAAGSPAVLQFSINGNTIGSSFNAPSATCQWAQFYSTWNSGSNTTANICIVNQNTTGGGNDFALDDINFVGLCDATDTVVVTVHNPTTTNIDTAVCNGVTYTFPDGTTSTVSAIDTTLLIDRFGCDSTIITNLTVNPTYNSTVFESICAGNTYTLPDGIIVDSTGSYITNLTTAQGCDSVIITNLTVKQPLAGTVYDTICAGTTYTLPSGTTVNSTGTYTSTLTTAQGCDSVVTTYLTVNPVSASTVYDTICRGNNYSLPNGTAVNTSGSYPVILSNQFGCDSVVTTILTVIGIDVTTQVNAVPCYGEAGGTITVTANGGLQPYDYSITSTNNTITNSTTNVFNNVLADDYLVSVSDDYGCSTVITTTVTQPPLLVVNNNVIDVSCYNDDNGQVIVTASGGTPAYVFSLTNQADNQSGMFSGLTADDYTYTVTDANGCLDTATVTVTQPNEIIISLNPDSVSIDLSESAQLLATTNYDPTANYNWSPASGLSCTNCPNPVVTANRSLVYSLEVSVNINGNNCYAYAGVPVTVIPNYDIFIPNAFTPNGNGQNDFFRIYGNLPAVKYVEVAIFDRIGEKVYQINDINFEWDGVYKGKLLQPGVYVYTIRVVFIDSHAEKLFKGSITLLR